MITFFVLLAWISTGTAVAVSLADEREPLWAWVPMTAFFGPLWLSLALDRRALAVASPRGFRSSLAVDSCVSQCTALVDSPRKSGAQPLGARR